MASLTILPQYYRSNIGNQIPHSLVLSVDSQQEGGYIDLDAVIVFRASPGNSTVTPFVVPRVFG